MALMHDSIKIQPQLVKMDQLQVHAYLSSLLENETHHRQMRSEILLLVIPRPMNTPSFNQTAVLTPIFQRV